MTPDQNQAKLVTPTEPGHFAYIDAVRGLAFLAVLTLHAAFAVGHFPAKTIFLQGGYGGYGVQLFFLASAITLCNSMSTRRKVDRFPVFSFYLRRLFRIAPLFWVAIIFYWSCPNVMPAFWLSKWAPNGVHPAYFALTALFFHGWHPYTFNSIVPGGWSIAVEMTFYLFFPFIFYLLGSSVKKSAALVIASILYLKILAHVGTWLQRHYFAAIPDDIWGFFAGLWFPSQLPVFLTGFLAYHLIANANVRSVVKKQVWAGCLFCFCATLLLLLFYVKTRFITGTFLIVLTLGALCIIFSGESLPGLVNPFIRYLGKISYSCYLVHFAALGLALKLLGIHLTADAPYFDTGHAFSNLRLFLEIILITLTITIVISTVTLHLIENPGIALGRRIIRRLNAPAIVDHKAA